MKSRIPLALASLLFALPAAADLVINEVRVDNSGTNDIEYFELYNNGGAPVNLAGYTYLVIGDGTGGSGVIEQVTTFTSGSVPAGGWYVVAESSPAAATITGVDADGDTVVDLPVTPDLVTPLNFENSDNVTHLLVQGFSGANGNDLDTNDDGVLDVTPWTTVVDAVGIIEEANPPAATEYSYGAALGFVDVGPDGAFLPGHVFRIGNGPTWAIGAFGTDGGGGVIASSGAMLSDTPGVTNPSIGTGSLSLSLSNNPISEADGFSATTLTVTRVGSTAGDLTVTLSLDDTSEAMLQGTEVIIFDGLTEATIDIDAVDDLWGDGDQTVTITATAPNYGMTDTTLTVQDNGDSTGLLLNEVYYTTTFTDANGDDDTGFADAFVEIVNISASPIDLSFYTLRENGYSFRFEVHVFPEGTILAPGSALVVFGGGGITPGTSAAFGTAEVQLSSAGGLFLSTDGDQLSLHDASEIEVAAATLPDVTATPAAGSLTLATDGDFSSGYVRHTTTLPATEYSPGTQIDGTPFATVSQALTVTVNTPTVVENAGNAPGALTVTLPANATSDTIVRFFSSDLSELIVQDSATISSGTDSVTIDLFPVDDSEVDGSQIVTVTAIVSGFLNDSGEITVEDDGLDTPVFTDLVINEVDADQVGTDAAEFIELYNKTGSMQSLDGLVLVLFNGSGDIVYDAIDLSGHTIPANGFFVVGSSSVPNVNLVEFTTNGIQNGQDAVALYKGSVANFANGTAVGAVTGTLVDAVVYDTSDADDPELLAALTPGKPQIDENGNGNGATESISRVPDGGAAFDTTLFVAQTPTPGATNVLPATDFAAWIAGYPGATNTGAEETNDNDGPNILDAYYGTDPTADDDNAILIAGQAPGSLTLRHKLSKDLPSDVLGAYQWSSTLGSWLADGASDGPITVSFGTPTVVDGSHPDYDIVDVTATISGGTLGDFFARLNVTLDTP